MVEQGFARATLQLLLITAGLLLGACTPAEDPAQQAATFCATLDSVNRGEVNTGDQPELAGHARVLNTLLNVAPEAIEDELDQFHAAFANWAAAVSGDQPMLDTFDDLTDPSLAGAEGRIADYIADHCGLRLGDGSYKEAPRPSAQDLCPGWPRVGSPNTFNNFPNLPDISGANYFANDYMISRIGLAPGDAFAVEPGGWVELRGQYPYSRYFAYHPNDMDLNNLKTLRDRDLEPEPGSVNRFREAAATDSGNYYTAKLVFGPEPAKPEPNTSYVGGVPLPAVTIYNADGEVTDHFDECDLYARGGADIRTELRFPVLPIADHRARATPQWSTSSNFDAPSDTMANADVQYLSTTYSRRFGDIFVVRARRLSAPDTRAGTPVSAAGYDVRFYSLCNYNIWNGAAIDCMLDNELKVDEEGFYTLVISDAEHRPQNLEEEHATWMDWGPFLDGQLSFRHVFRENPRVAEIAAALVGAPVSAGTDPYVPRATPCTRAQFEAGGWPGCTGSNHQAGNPR
jgi:hypothetical protein